MGKGRVCVLPQRGLRDRASDTLSSLGFLLALVLRDARCFQTFCGPQAGHSAPPSSYRSQPAHQSQSVSSPSRRRAPNNSPHSTVDTTKPPPVKFQEIIRDGVSTIVRSSRFYLRAYLTSRSRLDASKSLLCVSLLPLSRLSRAANFTY